MSKEQPPEFYGIDQSKLDAFYREVGRLTIREQARLRGKGVDELLEEFGVQEERWKQNYSHNTQEQNHG